MSKNREYGEITYNHKTETKKYKLKIRNCKLIVKITVNYIKETSTERRIVLNWPALIHCGSLLGTIHCPFSWESPFFWFSRSNQVICVNYQLSEEAFDILRCESSSSSGNLVISWPRKASRTPEEATWWTFVGGGKVIRCTNCQHLYYPHLNYGVISIQMFHGAPWVGGARHRVKVLTVVTSGCVRFLSGA